MTRHRAIAPLAALPLLATVLLLPACDQGPDGAALDDADIEAVAHVEVRGLLASPWLKDAVDGDVFAGSDMPKACVAVAEDLDAVTVAKAKSPTKKGGDPAVELFLRGPDDAKQLSSCIDSIRAKAKAEGEDTKSLTLTTTWVESDLVLLSNRGATSVDAAKDRYAQLIANDPSPGASKVWFVASTLGHDAKGPAAASGWLQLDTGLDGRLEVAFGEAATASEARTKLQAVVVPMALIPDVAPIVDIIDVGGKGDTLTIDVSADADQLGALKALVEAKHGGKGSGARIETKAHRPHHDSENDFVFEVEI